MSETGMQKLSEVIDRELTLYTTGVQKSVKRAAITVGTDIVKELRSLSPKRKGKYARSWTLDKHKKNGTVIRNAKHYQLTHLLEFGHDVKRGRRVVGKTKAYTHIRRAEREGVKKFADEVEQLIKNIDRE